MAKGKLVREMEKKAAAADEAMAAAKAELDKLERDKKAVEKRFGDGEPYDYESIIRKARTAAENHFNGALDLGAYLLRLKANEPHGQFLKALERIGIQARIAQKYMVYRLKFGDMGRLKALPGYKLDILGQLSEGEIEELDKKGELGSIKVDELDTMNAGELRDLIRKERERDTKRLKKAEEQFYQVKNERDYLKDNTGTSLEFDRWTNAATRALSKIFDMDLSEVDISALDQFISIANAQITRLSKRAHPENWTMDADVDLGKVEASDRKKTNRR